MGALSGHCFGPAMGSAGEPRSSRGQLTLCLPQLILAAAPRFVPSSARKSDQRGSVRASCSKASRSTVDQETKGQERRLVVVTGGSSGIGLACADRFRRDDADVRVADVQDREHPVDISDEAAVEAFFAGLPSAPAVLVNAAGIGLGAHIL